MAILPFSGLMIAWFVAAASFVLVVFLLLGSRSDRESLRIEGLAGSEDGDSSRGGSLGGLTSSGVRAPLGADARPGRWTGRRIRQADVKQSLRDRMTQAGLYSARAATFVMIFRIVLMIGPAAMGVVAWKFGFMSLRQGIAIGVFAGLAGTVAPALWLGHVKRLRQTKIRRALPDALDVMVVCLEGGISLAAAFSRVARELGTAHPMLAVEFNIVERQIQMGLSTGEAVRGIADRFDLEELRSMASVVMQAEKVGASVSVALRVFADTLREKRHQRAEEMAHKASVTLLFPTILFIFPGIFIVLLGPAAIRIYQEVLNGFMRQT